MLRLHDTPLGRAVDFVPAMPGRVSMYVCGPTVYDVPHLGHGRFVLVFDVLRRYLEWSGNEVMYVSNITDVDDKIIARAAQDGSSAEEVAQRYEEIWYSAVDRLGVKRPTADPHASHYVESMVALVERLVAKAKAYETPDGVYLEVATVADYGLLARQPLDSLRAGARVAVGDAKRSPLDFALWKKTNGKKTDGKKTNGKKTNGKKTDAEPPSWPSPWGPGRPGWHTECVVMSLDLLGEGFDLHGAGIDLAFPHHENERAQAVADGRRFARHWAHNGFVEVDGAKMSKSLGNFTSLVDLLDVTDARAYRLMVLQSHYRAPVEVTGRTVEAASRTLAGLDDFARRMAELPPAVPDPNAMARFRELMDDDLDTPGAVAHMSDLRRRANTALDRGDTTAAAPLAAAVVEMAGAVGLELAGVRAEIDAASADIVRQRDEARKARDFTAADRLRDHLMTLGWVVEDTPSGTRIHR